MGIEIVSYKTQTLKNREKLNIIICDFLNVYYTCIFFLFWKTIQKYIFLEGRFRI